MIRLFTGLEIPPEIATRLTALQSGLEGARWIEAEDFHITLRFLGDIPEDLAADADDALTQIPFTPFDVEIEGVGAFGGPKPTSLYAGVKPGPELALLQARHESAMRRVGLAPETRNYLPHVTLARFNRIEPESVYRYIEAHNLFACPRFLVARTVLFSARPGKGGGPYVAERYYPEEEWRAP